MSPKKRSTRSVSEQEALSYLKKAEEFYLTMAEAFQKDRWNAAGPAPSRLLWKIEKRNLWLKKKDNRAS